MNTAFYSLCQAPRKKMWIFDAPRIFFISRVRTKTKFQASPNAYNKAIIKSGALKKITLLRAALLYYVLTKDAICPLL